MNHLTVCGKIKPGTIVSGEEAVSFTLIVTIPGNRRYVLPVATTPRLLELFDRYGTNVAYIVMGECDADGVLHPHHIGVELIEVRA